MRKIISIVLVTMIISISVVFAVNNDSGENIESKLVLTDNVRLKEVAVLMKDSGFKLKGMQSISKVENRKYSGFYLINEKLTLEESMVDFQEQYSAMLSEGIAALEKQISETKEDKKIKSLEVLLSDTIKRKEKYEKEGGINISDIYIVGDMNEIVDFKQKHVDKIDEIQFKNKDMKE